MSLKATYCIEVFARVMDISKGLTQMRMIIIKLSQLIIIIVIEPANSLSLSVNASGYYLLNLYG